MIILEQKNNIIFFIFIYFLFFLLLEMYDVISIFFFFHKNIYNIRFLLFLTTNIDRSLNV